MIDGTGLFCLYAQPPNLLGYCGPEDRATVAALAGGLMLPAEEMTRIAVAFQGAWPYLELIGGLTGREPLAPEVVEAYWVGNWLLAEVDLLDWGNSVSERFRRQAGTRWDAVEDALTAGGLPNHAFHVFCVYPWVGLLKEGFVGPSLEVLDRCRISWGKVTAVDGELAVVERRPLAWRDDALAHGEAAPEAYRLPPGGGVAPGDHVSLHWDFICRRLDRGELTRLSTVHDRHMAIANTELSAALLEPSR